MERKGEAHAMLDLDPIRKRAEGAIDGVIKAIPTRNIPTIDDAFVKVVAVVKEDVPLLIAEVERLREYENNLKAACDMQTEDEGLWFKAERATEGYLQRALRRIHALIGGDKDALERIAMTDKEEFFE